MIALRMTNLHPYQYIFFNHIISHSEENIRNSMEMDYWGISYYEALKNILQSDTSQQIKIKFANFPGEANVLMLDEKDRKRIQISYSEDWKYFISNFRQHPADYTNGKMINHMHRLNSTINATFINENSN